MVGAKALLDPIRAMRNTIGTITDPNTAWMLLGQSGYMASGMLVRPEALKRASVSGATR